MAKFGLTGAPPMVRAMNLLVNRPARDIATAARGSSGRMLTSVPWQGAVLVGTFQSPEVVTEGGAPTGEMIDACLAEANVAFPKLQATRADIRLVHCGLTPAAVRNGKAELLSEPQVSSHAREGAAGVHSLVGVKYTTARLAAEHAVDAVCKELGRSRGRCVTARQPLPYAGIADFEGRLVETLREAGLELDRDVMDHLGAWYGTEATTVVEYARTAGLIDRLAPGCPLLTGEVAYAVEFGATVHLSDVVMRRLPLGSAGHPGPEAIARAAEIMGERLNWSPERRAEEIAAVERLYP
jgi:glycerol-3-phosphate dehydrogenase